MLRISLHIHILVTLRTLRARIVELFLLAYSKILDLTTVFQIGFICAHYSLS